MFLSWLLRPIAYLGVPFALLCRFSTSPMLSQKVQYYLRATLYLTTMSAVALTAAFVGLGMNLVGQKYNVNYVVAKTFYALASRAVNITVEVEGEEWLEKAKGAVVVSNHQSMLDILFVGRIFPLRTTIMSKKSLQFSPLGPFMRMSGSIFIDRGNTGLAMRSMEAAAATMKRERVGLWVFPEGTRHCEQQPGLLPFKKGAFHLAVQAQAPIVPVVCENYWWLYRSGLFGTGVLRLKVLPPIQTEGLTIEDVGSLAARVREDMLGALFEISTHYQDTTDKKSVGGRSPTPQPNPSQRSVIIEEPQPSPAIPSSSSKESLSSSTYSYSSSQKKDSSENGHDTEEDEGMVLVGRPKQ